MSSSFTPKHDYLAQSTRVFSWQETERLNLDVREFSEGDGFLKQPWKANWIVVSFQLCKYFNQQVKRKAITTSPVLSVACEAPLSQLLQSLQPQLCRVNCSHIRQLYFFYPELGCRERNDDIWEGLLILPSWKIKAFFSTLPAFWQKNSYYMRADKSITEMPVESQPQFGI